MDGVGPLGLQIRRSGALHPPLLLCLQEPQELHKSLKPRGFIKLNDANTRLNTSTEEVLTFRIHFDLNLRQVNARMGAKVCQA